MVPPTSNTPKGRSDLKSRFKNETKLSAAHFHELIDSSLNKPDERFYGVWKEKCIYPKAAVVYDDDSGLFWQAKQDICPQAQGQKPPSQDLDNWGLSPYQLYGIWNEEFAYAKGAVVYDKASGFFWQAKQDICPQEEGQKPPSQDLDNWHSHTYEDIKALREELTQLKQQLALLGVGLVGIIFWWLMGGIYHLVAGRM